MTCLNGQKSGRGSRYFDSVSAECLDRLLCNLGGTAEFSVPCVFWDWRTFFIFYSLLQKTIRNVK